MKSSELILIGFSVCFICLVGCRNENHPKEPERVTSSKKVLSLLAGSDNPRNSEGEFITLKDGRILFVYTHYTGTSSADAAPAYLASRYSDDDGDSWSLESKLVIENEGLQNVMSVSLLRIANGELAIYLRVNSLLDCQPMVRFSSDEGKA